MTAPRPRHRPSPDWQFWATFGLLVAAVAAATCWEAQMAAGAATTSTRSTGQLELTLYRGAATWSPTPSERRPTAEPEHALAWPSSAIWSTTPEGAAALTVTASLGAGWPSDAVAPRLVLACANQAPRAPVGARLLVGEPAWPLPAAPGQDATWTVPLPPTAARPCWAGLWWSVGSRPRPQGGTLPRWAGGVAWPVEPPDAVVVPPALRFAPAASVLERDHAAAAASAERPIPYVPLGVVAVTNGPPFYRVITGIARHCAVTPHAQPLAAWGQVPAVPACAPGAQPLTLAAYCALWRVLPADAGVTPEVAAMVRRSQCAGI